MSALLDGPGLAEIMPPPKLKAVALGRSPLDLISYRTTPRERCPRSFAVVGILGIQAVIIATRCGQWSCSVCGASKAKHFAGIARAGCNLSTERLRLFTFTSGRESAEESWEQLSPRWERFSERMARRGSRRLSYFGTVEMQKRGNPHLHMLVRDSGFIPKKIFHAMAHDVGFGFSDVRMIQPAAGVQYVVKYLHKSAGQEFPKGVRRIRRSRDWWNPPKQIVCKWGPDWQWQSIEHLDPDREEVNLRELGYQVVRFDQRACGDGHD